MHFSEPQRHLHVLCAYNSCLTLLCGVGGTTTNWGWSMIDPKTDLPVLLTLQEVTTSAAELAEAQRRRFSYLFSTWTAPRDPRVQVALVALEDRRMAARRKIIAELYQMDRIH
jgi:hypothetical protein